MQDEALDPGRAEAAFGERVRELRMQKKWTQKKLAELISVDASAISRIEQGIRAVRLGEAAQIASALGVDIDALVFGNEPRPEVWLQRYRDSANQNMHQLRAAAVEMADAYIEIAQALSQHPGLFSQLRSTDEQNGRHTPPTTVPEYFRWVEARIRAVFDPSHHNRCYTDDPKLAEWITDLVSAAVAGVITTEPFPETEIGMDDVPEA